MAQIQQQTHNQAKFDFLKEGLKVLNKHRLEGSKPLTLQANIQEANTQGGKLELKIKTESSLHTITEPLTFNVQFPDPESIYLVMTYGQGNEIRLNTCDFAYRTPKNGPEKFLLQSPSETYQFTKK